MSMHEAVVMDSAIDKLKECISQINPLVECLEDVKRLWTLFQRQDILGIRSLQG